MNIQTKKTYGDSISRTPALVVHHSNNEGIKREFYPEFKVVHDLGHLNANFFALYLSRLYEIENGVYFRMKSPYIIEDQIVNLIVELDL
jgi:hypothetical protein